MLYELLKKEFNSFSKKEKIIFPIVILIIVIISFILKDSKIALLSAICGISYTILAGKGKVYCYYIGLTGTSCYSYLAFTNGFYGNLALYTLYYLPMQILGIYNWSKHLKKDTNEIIKTCLTKKERIVYSLILIITTTLSFYILELMGGKNPVMDSITTIFSIIGQILTVKRCIEQWYIWFIVNLISLIMWINAYLHSSDCFATILMWSVYLILGIYFYIIWKKELNKNSFMIQ